MQIDHPILQFKNVSISYTPGKNAVNHVNADIKKNRITAIIQRKSPAHNKETHH